MPKHTQKERKLIGQKWLNTWNVIKVVAAVVAVGSGDGIESNVCARNTYENRNKVICFHGKFDPKLLHTALLQFQKRKKKYNWN